MIYGESGSGKSTLLKILTKQCTTYDGSITLNGEYDLSNIDISKAIGGIYPGNYIYSTDFLNNVTLFGTYNMDNFNKYIERHPNDKINYLLNIEDCSMLSNGEKQMVSIIRTYITNTPVILLDEAFSAIDIENREYFMKMILEHEPESKIIIMISHDAHIEDDVSFNEILHFDKGKIC